MRPPRDQPVDEDDVFGRPFLAGRTSSIGTATEASGPARDAPETRPYVMTGGRVDAKIDIPLETMVVTSTAGRYARPPFEAAQVLDLCTRAQSVVEVSARLRLPLGVVRVVIADLIADGLMEAPTPAGGSRHPAHDVALLRRLKHGVAAL
jgi:hypothetical protein